MKLTDNFMVHCVGGCSRGQWRDLRGLKPSQVTCGVCGSNKIAIWHEKACVYAESGQVDYPMFDIPHGTKVKGGKRP